ncbi:MAG: putative Sensors of blue-light using [Xanthobacteraceae bacterium]|jgi:hypothetical protein|nr:putative Sensors of blue-light using [Xanthobacteraceae bacterium]
MALVRLVYYAENRISPQAGGMAEQVADILASAAGTHRSAAITGGMIYDTCWFGQVLEGDEAAIAALYNEIAEDPRHGEIVVLEHVYITSRRFTFWWMASAAWGSHSAELLQTHCQIDRFDPRRTSGAALTDLVAALVHHQTHYTVPPSEFAEAAVG